MSTFNADAPPNEAEKRAIENAIGSRRSIRRFLPDPVSRADIEAILRVASRAPSGSNIQPWHVHVLTGESLTTMTRTLVAAHAAPDAAEKYQAEYDYYPRDWMAPYIDRRRKVGFELYRLVGIARGDKAAMHAQHRRNFVFFDAPVGLFFTIDRALEKGSWLDYGMFLENIMIAARAYGLDTCPQAAFNAFHRPIAEHLGLPSSEMLVCGMALGYADPEAVENTLLSEREALSSFVVFHD